ncbi:MAG TPA: hypothetical protein VMK13_15660 [Streptosporangiaceae bacterium]|nr:hypothetical protein [Streptosporangiaceae bacterium]
MAGDPTRRAVLAATATLPLLAAACGGVGALAAPPKPAPDVALLRDAISAEELMTVRYQAAISLVAGQATASSAAAAAGRSHGTAAGGSTDLAAVLRSLLGEHQEHLAQLRSRLSVPAGSPYPPAQGQRSVPGLRLPSAPRQLVADLAAAERMASARLARQLLGVSPSLAQLLASISAAEATHVPVLVAR